MLFERVKDALNHVIEHHRALGKYYKELADRASSVAAYQLLQYMSRHQRKLEIALQEEKDKIPTSLNISLLETILSRDLLIVFNDFEARLEISCDEIAFAAIQTDRATEHLFRELMANSTKTDSKNLFCRLAQLECEYRIAFEDNYPKLVKLETPRSI